MLLIAEIVCLVMGIMALARGKIALSARRVVTGARARWIGAVLILPLPLAFVVGVVMALSNTVEGRRFDAADFWLSGVAIEVSILGLCGIAAVLCGVLGPKQAIPSRRSIKAQVADDYQEMGAGAAAGSTSADSARENVRDQIQAAPPAPPPLPRMPSETVWPSPAYDATEHIVQRKRSTPIRSGASLPWVLAGISGVLFLAALGVLLALLIIEPPAPRKAPVVLAEKMAPNPPVVVGKEPAIELPVEPKPKQRRKPVGPRIEPPVEPNGHEVAKPLPPPFVRPGFNPQFKLPVQPAPVAIGPDPNGRIILQGDLIRVLAMTYTPDGQGLVVATWSGKIQHWSLAPPKLKKIVTLAAGPDLQGSFAFSPDCKWFAYTCFAKFTGTVVSPGSLSIFDTATGQLLSELRNPEDDGGRAAGSIPVAPPFGDSPRPAFSPDGERLIAIQRHVSVWDWRAKKMLWTQLPPGVGVPKSVAFSPDGKTAAAGYSNGAIRVWDVVSGTELAVLTCVPIIGGWNGVNTLTFQKDGKGLVAGTNDGAFRFWDVAARREAPVIKLNRFGVFGVQEAALSRRRSLLAVGISDGIHFLDIEKRVEVGMLPETWSQGDKMAVSHHGDSLAVARTGQVHILDMAKTELVKSPPPFSIPSGKKQPPSVARPTSDNLAPALAPPEDRIRLATRVVTALCFSQNGASLSAACIDRKVRVWDMDSHKLSKMVELPFPKALRRLTLSDGGTLAVAVTANGPSLLVSELNDIARPVEFTPDVGRPGFDSIALAASANGRWLGAATPINRLASGTFVKRNKNGLQLTRPRRGPLPSAPTARHWPRPDRVKR